MSPEEDALWPTCNSHNKKHMCEDTMKAMGEGLDASSIEPGVYISVPVFPKERLMATVSIGSEAIVPDICYPLAVVKEQRFADPEIIDIGVWSKGEGRKAISYTVQAWVRAEFSSKGNACPSERHGLKQERESIAFTYDQHSWAVAFKGRCYACCREDFSKTPTASSDNFGMNLIKGNDAQGHRQGAAYDTTRQLLRQRRK